MTLKKHRLYIPKKGKKLLGVSIALANYFKVDVILIRIFWVLLFLPGGFPGLIPYLICWVLIPNQEDLS